MKKYAYTLMFLAVFLITAALSAQDITQPEQPTQPVPPVSPAQPVQPVPQFDRSGLTEARYRMSTLLAMPVIVPEEGSLMEEDDPTGTPAPIDYGAYVEQAVGTIADAVIQADGTLSYLLVDIEDLESVQPGLYLIPADMFSAQNQIVQLTAEQPQDDFIAVPEEDQIQQQIGENAYRASAVMDWAVSGSGGMEVGEIEDMVVDLQEGEVLYAALSRGGVLGIGDELFAVPFEAMEFAPGEEQFSVNLSEQDFENQQGFDGEDWPEEGDERWLQESPATEGAE